MLVEAEIVGLAAVSQAVSINQSPDVVHLSATVAAIQTLHVNHPNAFGTSKTSKTTKILGLHRIAMDGASEIGFGCHSWRGHRRQARRRSCPGAWSVRSDSQASLSHPSPMPLSPMPAPGVDSAAQLRNRLRRSQSPLSSWFFEVFGSSWFVFAMRRHRSRGAHHCLDCHNGGGRQQKRGLSPEAPGQRRRLCEVSVRGSCWNELEAPSGFEPLHKGFADLSLSHLGTAPHALGCGLTA